MNENLINFFLNQQIQVSTTSFLESIFFAAILSILTQLVYIKFSTTLSDKNEFSKNFIILSLATTIVITIVKSSLALSLGLVGALSIVRFRAAIKEPEELVYLFLIIATGLGCGSGQIIITSIGIITSLILIIIYSYYFRNKKLLSSEITNTCINIEKRISANETDELLKKIYDHCTEIKFISYTSTKNETVINLDIKVKNFSKLSKISEIVKNKYYNSKILFAKNNIISL